MRTTITIDDDVLAAAKALAAQQRRSVGEIVSDLARRSLHHPVLLLERNGVPLLTGRMGSPPVTLEVVNALRDEGS